MCRNQTHINMNIFTFKDGHSYYLISKGTAYRLLGGDEEVYGLCLNEETEAIIGKAADLESFQDFGIELTDRPDNLGLDIPKIDKRVTLESGYEVDYDLSGAVLYWGSERKFIKAFASDETSTGSTGLEKALNFLMRGL